MKDYYETLRNADSVKNCVGKIQKMFGRKVTDVQYDEDANAYTFFLDGPYRGLGITFYDLGINLDKKGVVASNVTITAEVGRSNDRLTILMAAIDAANELCDERGI